MFLYDISCTAICCCLFVFLFKENNSTNSKPQTACIVVGLNCMLKIPVFWCLIGAEPYCRLPSWGGRCNFLSAWPDHLFSEVLQEPNIFESFSPVLERSWNWPVGSTARNTHDEIRFFSLKASQKHPSEVHRYSLYCSIRPHNFNIWRREAKFKRVTISILISWNWLRVRHWILHSSSPSSSHSGVLPRWWLRLWHASSAPPVWYGWEVWSSFIMVTKIKSETGARCSAGDDFNVSRPRFVASHPPI